MFEGQLHPGVGIALKRFQMDETEAARAVASGELESPHQFANSWYFSLRITGTEAAYREKHKEYVWRDPKLYLHQAFLDRCLGLPVIIEHPPKEMLDAKEYADRNIGSIVYAWIKDDEVWGVARILDGRAAQFMREHTLSTSPAVVFLDPAVNTKVELDNKKHLLIEGKPALLDHLAVVAAGVWDKDGPPSGVEGGPPEAKGDSGSGEAADIRERALVMADEDKKEEMKEEEKDRKDDDKRDDADAGEKLDKILTGIDSVHKRMDAHEERMDRVDARFDAMDKKRDDAKKDDKRDDDDPDEERAQAAQLEKLAEEEEEEAEEAEDDRKDAKRDDAKPKFLARKDGESKGAHSKRVHAFASKHDSKRFMKRDDESAAEHSERCDKACGDSKRDDDDEMMDKKRDDKRRDDKRRDDRKRDDRRMDRRRDDDDEEKEEKEEERKDRKRDDEETEKKEEEKEEVKADSAAMQKIRDDVDKLRRRIEDRSDEEHAAFGDTQARADEAFSALGSQAPRPLSGETLMDYRLRLIRKLQVHSPKWKDGNLPAIARADAKHFGHIEAEIYADAQAAAREPTDIPLGQLREVTKRDRMTGRVMHEFYGNPLTWMQQFMLPGQCATRISRPPQG